MFPDARLIFTHREPQRVVGSSCSLVWNQMIIHSDDVDAREIGREWLRKTELQIERMRKARLRIAPEQRIDVRYEEMERDWPEVMRSIYAFLDMDIEPALPAMREFISSSGRELHRHPHRYSLEAFGLDAEDVTERFRSYTEAFELGVPAPPRAAPDTVAPQPETSEPVFVPALADWETAKPARAAAGRS